VFYFLGFAVAYNYGLLCLGTANGDFPISLVGEDARRRLGLLLLFTAVARFDEDRSPT
jgi:hypothetical protein